MKLEIKINIKIKVKINIKLKIKYHEAMDQEIESGVRLGETVRRKTAASEFRVCNHTL